MTRLARIKKRYYKSINDGEESYVTLKRPYRYRRCDRLGRAVTVQHRGHVLVSWSQILITRIGTTFPSRNLKFHTVSSNSMRRDGVRGKLIVFYARVSWTDGPVAIDASGREKCGVLICCADGKEVPIRVIRILPS